MTPSEIATELAAVAFETRSHLFAMAHDTIRDLDANLKIATEALEVARSEAQRAVNMALNGEVITVGFPSSVATATAEALAKARGEQ